MAWNELQTVGEVPLRLAGQDGSVKVKVVEVAGTPRLDLRFHTPTSHTGKGLTLPVETAKAVVKLLQAGIKEAK